MSRRTYIGLDLAWKPNKNHSGVAILEECDYGAVFTEVDSLLSFESIKAFLNRVSPSAAVIAIDAPLVVKNLSRSRECERALSREYGGQHAACHSSNLSIFDRGTAPFELASWLESVHKFRHAPDASPTDKVMLEVYPHAALVALRGLGRIIRYKKGTVAARCEGLRDVQRTLLELFAESPTIVSSAPMEGRLLMDPTTLKGQARKSLEDELDAMLCAHLAYRYSRLGQHFQTFGDALGGYIVNPVRSPQLQSAELL